MRIDYRLVGGAVAAALVLVPAGTADPIAGIDQFPSGASAEIEILEQKDMVHLTGPTIIERGDRVGNTIPTEMLQLDLSGSTKLLGGGTLIVRVGKNFGLQSSPGEIDAHFVRNGDFAFGNSTFTIKDGRFTFVPRSGEPVHGQVAEVTVGTWITSLPPNRPRTGTPVVPALDHFKCYELKLKSRFKPRAVALADEFEPEQATLSKPVSLCMPVSKNRSQIRERRVPLKCYAITSTSVSPKKAELDVSVTNQFGTQTLTVREPQTLCAPSVAARLVKGRAALPKIVPGRLLDHFKCYAATPKQPLQSRTVRLEDKLELERARVLQARTLCNVVDKNRAGIRESQAHLVCYGIQDASHTLKRGGRTLVVLNQFGRERVKVRGAEALCVPSAKDPPCSEYAERSKAALLVNGNQVGTLNNARHIPFEKAEGSPCQ